MPSERTWHEGPPPHVGWWEARVTFADGEFPAHWGWWNGCGWSMFADASESAAAAAAQANRIGALSGSTDHVEWSDCWPENARVPRLDPTAGDWTFHHGGPCPDFGRAERVQVALRNGDTFSLYPHECKCWHWKHGTPGVPDTVAWRITRGAR